MFVEIEVAQGAFRLLRTVPDPIEGDRPASKMSVVVTAKLSVPMDLLTKRETDMPASQLASDEQRLLARVAHAQEHKREVDTLVYPEGPKSEAARASEKELRDQTLSSLLDEAAAETESAPRLEQFWTITVKGDTIVVHGAFADAYSAENSAKFLVESPIGDFDDVDVVSGRTWFATADFATNEVEHTTYVGNDELQKTLRNAQRNHDAARAVCEKAKELGVEPPVRRFDDADVVSASIS